MNRSSLLLAALAAVVGVVPVTAQETAERGAFVTRLGDDTIAVERFRREGAELRVEVLLRVPRTSLRVYRMRLDEAGRPVEMVATTHDPAAGADSPPTRTETVRWAADALHVESVGGEQPGAAEVAGGADVLPFIDMVHWPYELVLARSHAATADSLVVPLLTGRRTSDFVVRRVGAQVYTITHPFRGTMSVEVDARGRITSLDASRTTRALRVTRVTELDLPALARDFAAREARSGPAGELSGRGQVETAIAGANLAVDYGVPRKRGREIFGALVPWGEVWRTGANRATHFETDRDLRIGGERVPAGTYTLFTVPGPQSWTLIVNRRTDITGTAHDPGHDLLRTEMSTRELPEVVEEFTIRLDPRDGGGVLRLQWDRTEASVPFQVVDG